MTDTRDKVISQIRQRPGIHFNELVRTLDLAPGQVQYHLKKLRRAAVVVEEPLYGKTHYYTTEYGAWERRALAVLHRETAREILVHLLTNGRSRPGAVAERLDVARSTLEWHLDHLVEQDLVEKERGQRNHVTLSVSHPEETARMLRLVNPSLADRLLDRFTRLVDGLLDGESGSTDADQS
ncbi:winged helix-turn-helix transcriptional regulator [Halapricum salinum]|uniref:Winged helix-turn-helix transcriptional regulator n=1 Tax=Halapricum salinum TaxID=1457250 RepID=A0A4D6HEI3_9EURY|nr:winged helix-turn-helix transcriptional regulator [Halapricum salinum]QCC51971.1 winged helix-turn-helix transcriptional regulator [Halapricum salinum]